MSCYHWELKMPLPANYYGLQDAGFTPLLAQLLYNRGIKTGKEAEVFFKADESLSHDPMLMPDIEKAVSRTYRALLSGESIAVYGDFDADGITSTALVSKCLSSLGGNVIPYIPNRVTEGHGLRTHAIDELHKKGVSLIITVDCGVTAIPELEKCQGKGIDIIITDHHSPLETLPKAYAIVNPKLKDSKYPFSELAGVGVAFKFLQALYKSLGKTDSLYQMLDLVAIGTIADVMPLVNENRYLAKRGLKEINSSPRQGVAKIIEKARLKNGDISSENVAWAIAPRLNACGRLDHAIPGYNLMITESELEAEELAQHLEGKNQERQRLTTKYIAKAKKQINPDNLPSLIIIKDEECPHGILGLISGRMTDEYWRPSIVIKTGETVCSASCRSIPQFNITEALQKCGHLFTHFGGHAQAAGFTLPTENLPEVERILCGIAKAELKDIELKRFIEIDAEVRFSDLNKETYKQIQRLAPFGEGNPSPTFLSRNVEVATFRHIGENGHHLKLTLKQGNRLWNAIAFRIGESLSKVLHLPLDFVYNLEVDNWQGADSLRINIIDFKPSKNCQ